jgi:hypothetical protein
MQDPERESALVGFRALDLCGVDFSSAPSQRKPILIAEGTLGGFRRGPVVVDRVPAEDSAPGGAPPELRWRGLNVCSHWQSFEDFLGRPGPRLGAFDLPFGLPRPLLCAWGWDQLDHRAVSDNFAREDRAFWIARLKAFCAVRPAGRKFAHRACDLPVGSSPSMKWVNPPVVFMYREGFSRILKAGWRLPGFEKINEAVEPPHMLRLAVEAYPGALARSLVGRASYKADDAMRQNDARRQVRKRIVEGLATLPDLQLRLDITQESALLDDARGDALDAVLCLVIAARCALQGPPRWGAPERVDLLEGWIAA